MGYNIKFTIIMRKNDGPIIIEQTFNTSVENVWVAITEIDQMRQWYFENILSFKAEVGFKTQFNVQSQDRNFLHIWEVTKVIPGKMITYNWKYKDYPGDSFVVFEIFKNNNLTKLRLTHHVQESFPDNSPEFARKSGIDGWTYIIRKSLKEFLENN